MAGFRTPQATSRTDRAPRDTNRPTSQSMSSPPNREQPNNPRTTESHRPGLSLRLHPIGPNHRSGPGHAYRLVSSANASAHKAHIASSVDGGPPITLTSSVETREIRRLRTASAAAERPEPTPATDQPSWTPSSSRHGTTASTGPCSSGNETQMGPSAHT